MMFTSSITERSKDLGIPLILHHQSVYRVELLNSNLPIVHSPSTKAVLWVRVRAVVGIRNTSLPYKGVYISLTVVVTPEKRRVKSSLLSRVRAPDVGRRVDCQRIQEPKPHGR